MENKLFSHNEISDIFENKALSLKNGFINSIVIDSRKAVLGSLFVPLVGEVTDGNLYIEGALKQGCKCSLVSREFFDTNSDKLESLCAEFEASIIIVENGLKALQKLAAEHIKRFPNLKVISITGSSGKTTTKEILGSILKSYKSVLVTEGNYNSETGLPLTVFRIKESHEIAVLEMGMSRPGEIKALVDIINPDISIITNIGSAHIGFFGTRDGISKEKKDAFANFTGNEIAIIPSWDDYSDYLQIGVNGRVICVCDSPSYINEVSNHGFDGWEFLYENEKVKFPYMGLYNFLNALIAISCARELGVPVHNIVKGLEQLPKMFGRGEILDGKNRVIRDCYNANPESTLNALELLNKTNWSGKKIPIIGSMLELGDNSPVEHEKIARFAVSIFSEVILCGIEFKKIYRIFSNELGVHYFENTGDLKISINKLIEPGSLVLLKASRGVRLEEITEVLI